MGDERAVDEERLIRDLLRLFSIRVDTFTEQQTDGSHIRISDSVTPELVARHLRGEVTLGFYQIQPITNLVKWLCLDVDTQHHEDPEGVVKRSVAGLRECIPPEAILLEASRYPDPSFHVWGFFDPPIEAKYAKTIGEMIKEKTGEADLEVFPKQTAVGEGEFGNLVKLPLGLHQAKGKWSKILDKETFTPLPSDLSQVIACELSRKDELLLLEAHPELRTEKTEYEPHVESLRPCFHAMVKLENQGALGDKGTLERQAKMALVHEALGKGFGADNIVTLFSGQLDYNEKESRYHVRKLAESAIKDGIHPYSCNTIVKRGWCTAEDPNQCHVSEFYGEGVGKAPVIITTARARPPSHADKIVMMAEELDVRLFVDQRGNPYIVISDEVGDKIFRLRTGYVRTWLASLLWDSEQKAPGAGALQSALNILEAKANKEVPLKLHNRVAPDGLGGIYVDMCNDYWQAIHVTKKGWEIVDRPPILFRRYTHQRALPIPLKGGSVLPLLELINLKPSDPSGDDDATTLKQVDMKVIPVSLNARTLKTVPVTSILSGVAACKWFSSTHLLYLVIIISYFIPGIPHIVLILYGMHGSGKSIAHKITREIVDPSHTPVLTMPRKTNELLQLLDHHYFPIFDNVSTLPAWISDMLCRAVSGSGSSKRKLYTDDEDEIYEFYRCIGINGINIAATRGDLLDRCGLFGLKEIKPNNRQTEKAIFKKLEKIKGEVLGGILDILVIALQIYDEIELTGLYRMADFTIWGSVITQAMGLDPQDFITEYEKNITSQRLEALSSDPVADVLEAFILSTVDNQWRGTISQLLTALNAVAKELSISITQRAWPKSPTLLSRRINLLTPNLPLIGLKVERPKARIVSIKSVTTVKPPKRKTPTPTDPSVIALRDAEARARALERRPLIIDEAIRILRESSGEMFQKLFFDKLNLRDYPQEETSPILRNHHRFRFTGMSVYLRDEEGEP